MDYINVTIKRIGSQTIDYTAAPGITVQEVLTANNINSTGSEVRLNGVRVNLDAPINNNSELFISKAIAGATN